MKYLVTGGAGFIGMHLAKRLAEVGHQVVIVDNLNDYYDIELKKARLRELGIDTIVSGSESLKYDNLKFSYFSIEDKQLLNELFDQYDFEIVVNLAAQAGVRYSITNPDVYIRSNVVGFLNVLEAVRNHNVKHLVYASSSSVYGLNGKTPYSPHDAVSHPVSLYAASKISNEVMAHAYSHLYGIPTTGLRFFTVYGPWGRPDMSPYLFADAISADKPLKLFNNGHMRRDFTYIDDIIRGILLLLDVPPVPMADWDSNRADPATSSAPYRIYNIGNEHPVDLIDYVKAFEQAFSKSAKVEMYPMQPGDVLSTSADMTDMRRDFGFEPSIDITEGVRRYVSWFKTYYGR